MHLIASFKKYACIWNADSKAAFGCLRLVKACLPQLKSVEGFEPGQQLNVEEIFSVGDKVDVAGTSIGKGFQGEFVPAQLPTPPHLLVCHSVPGCYNRHMYGDCGGGSSTAALILVSMSQVPSKGGTTTEVA